MKKDSLRTRDTSILPMHSKCPAQVSRCHHGAGHFNFVKIEVSR